MSASSSSRGSAAGRSADDLEVGRGEKAPLMHTQTPNYGNNKHKKGQTRTQHNTRRRAQDEEEADAKICVCVCAVVDLSPGHQMDYDAFPQHAIDRFLPSIRGRPFTYGLTGNLSAGLTVALINVPLSLSLAVASATTPQAGMITAIWGALAAAICGGSQYNVMGPTQSLLRAHCSVVVVCCTVPVPAPSHRPSCLLLAFSVVALSLRVAMPCVTCGGIDPPLHAQPANTTLPFCSCPSASAECKAAIVEQAKQAHDAAVALAAVASVADKPAPPPSGIAALVDAQIKFMKDNNIQSEEELLSGLPKDADDVDHDAIINARAAQFGMKVLPTHAEFIRADGNCGPDSFDFEMALAKYDRVPTDITKRAERSEEIRRAIVAWMRANPGFNVQTAPDREGGPQIPYRLDELVDRGAGERNVAAAWERACVEFSADRAYVRQGFLQGMATHYGHDIHILTSGTHQTERFSIYASGDPMQPAATRPVWLGNWYCVHFVPLVPLDFPEVHAEEEFAGQLRRAREADKNLLGLSVPDFKALSHRSGTLSAFKEWQDDDVLKLLEPLMLKLFNAVSFQALNPAVVPHVQSLCNGIWPAAIKDHITVVMTAVKGVCALSDSGRMMTSGLSLSSRTETFKLPLYRAVYRFFAAKDPSLRRPVAGQEEYSHSKANITALTKLGQYHSTSAHAALPIALAAD